jgi:glutamine amidotransferase
MIAIVNYGLGNIRAFVNVYDRLNIRVVVAETASDLRSATKIILPGVGAFDRAIDLLDQSGMRGPLEECVLNKGIPVLGVCVGMQMLGRCSEEGRKPGFGWIDGNIKSLRSEGAIVLPHMGWNDVTAHRYDGLFAGLQNGCHFYFLHSYYFDCERSDDILASCNYSNRFCCAVNARNIYGVQFHPEKSHRWGVQLLKNFAELV